MYTGHRCLPKLVTNVAAADGCHWDTLLSLTSSKWLFFLWALSGLMVASICLSIGHIPPQATISYLNPLWQLLVWIFQDFTFSSGRANHIWNFESLPSCGFLRPCIFLWALKGRKWGGLWSIRQRVCQLTHSDLGVSHGWAKRRDLRGPREEGGAYYLPTPHSHSLGELLLHRRAGLTPTTITRSLPRVSRRTISAHNCNRLPVQVFTGEEEVHTELCCCNSCNSCMLL